MVIQRINPDLCRSGCRLCVDECSYDIFEIDEKTHKAVVRYPEDCETCIYLFFCLSVCPVGAIEYTVDQNQPFWYDW